MSCHRVLVACILSIGKEGVGGGTCASKWLSDFNCPSLSFPYPYKLLQCDLITLVQIPK